MSAVSVGSGLDATPSEQAAFRLPPQSAWNCTVSVPLNRRPLNSGVVAATALNVSGAETYVFCSQPSAGLLSASDQPGSQLYASWCVCSSQVTCMCGPTCGVFAS